MRNFHILAVLSFILVSTPAYAFTCKNGMKLTKESCAAIAGRVGYACNRVPEHIDCKICETLQKKCAKKGLEPNPEDVSVVTPTDPVAAGGRGDSNQSLNIPN